MGLDSPLPHDHDGEARPEAPRPEAARPEAARKATTASMQNLLAQYFADQSFGAPAPAPAPAETPAPMTSSSPLTSAYSRSETRRKSTEESVAASFARLEAAFVALTPEPPATLASVAPSPAPHPASEEWPEAARRLITSLTQERDELRGQVQEISTRLHSAQGQADNDVLTPTLNRRAFLREVQRAMADCKRYGEEACLIYLDMDSFKAINDNYGHAAGDRALIYVAETLKASVREGDAVARIGGDEFAILLRRADLKSSRIKAMKLEAELMMGTFEYEGLHLKTGGSFGVRAYAGQASGEAWLSEADAAMFLVKKSSR